MALGAHALTTLATVKDELRITDSEQDARLDRLIDSVTSAFELFTGRRLKSRTYKPSGAGAGEVNLKLNGNDRLDVRRFMFPEFPLTVLTALTTKDADLLNPVTVNLAKTVFDPETAIVRFLEAAYEWPKGQQNIEATFTAGLLTTHPDWPRLDALCVKQVIYEFRDRDRGREGVSSMTVGDQTVSYIVRNLHPDVEFGLHSFRRELVRA